MNKHTIEVPIQLMGTPIKASITLKVTAYKPSVIRADPFDSHPEEALDFSICTIEDTEENIQGLTWLYYKNTGFAAEVDQAVFLVLDTMGY